MTESAYNQLRKQYKVAKQETEDAYMELLALRRKFEREWDHSEEAEMQLHEAGEKFERAKTQSTRLYNELFVLRIKQYDCEADQRSN